ncbi:UvrB/UvrC motif-containing protein, partial [Glaesserella parasuis]|nr:UvrB/UvrC motif-containing protein [Glaesserella parasuis]
QIQISGRTARNLNGKEILYNDRITNSMQKAITETERRREKQQKYNEEHGIVPQALNKKVGELLDIGQTDKPKRSKKSAKSSDDQTAYIPKSRKELEKELKVLEQQMRDFAKDLEFEKAAAVRDKIRELKAYLLEL